MSRDGAIRSGALLATLVTAGAIASCSGAHNNYDFSDGDGGSGPQADAGGDPGFFGDASGGDGGFQQGPIQPSGPVTDFPSPVLDGAVPANAPDLFGDATQGAPNGGPCLVEPESDVIYPQNWLRPRFRWIATGGANLFELRLHVANQIKDLVVYTANKEWTMPPDLWNALRTHSPTEAMTITLRSGTLAGASLQGKAIGSSTPMGIAPVQATGAIVYWTTNDVTTNSSVLKAFSPGDESVQTLLTPAQYTQSQGATTGCFGCHTSTPDGEFAVFTSSATPVGTAQQQWNGGIALIDPSKGAVGAAAPFMGAAGTQALARWNSGGITFSPGHWKDGDRRALVSYDNNNNTSNIVLSWVDLEATDPAKASGIVARTGDSNIAAAPAWSRDGNTIAYASTNRECTGRLGNCTPQYNLPPDQGSRADIYTVPYAGGAGGTATPLPGASDPNLQEYYPAYSPDDKLLVFNRVANDLNLYDQPAAEVFVIPSKGGTATRIAANDPPACSGQTSPGVGNSWPKWGPTAQTANGNTYYWMIFSSKRMSAKTPQLYITSVVGKADGSIETHGAIYLWNQPAAEQNHTPAWDTFKVPPPPR